MNCSVVNKTPCGGGCTSSTDCIEHVVSKGTSIVCHERLGILKNNRKNLEKGFFGSALCVFWQTPGIIPTDMIGISYHSSLTFSIQHSALSIQHSEQIPT